MNTHYDKYKITVRLGNKDSLKFSEEKRKFDVATTKTGKW